MESQAIENLVQLGFAAGLAGWLVKWLTGQLKDAIDKSTAVVGALMLLNTELYELLIRHDAQIRGVNPTAGDTDEECQRRATTVYTQLLNRIDQLNKNIEKKLETI